MSTASSSAPPRPRVDLPLALVAVALPLACIVAIASGAFQDYAVHLDLWLAAWRGADPYVPGVHAYGPAFNAIAPLLGLHLLAPKLFFVAVWLGTAAWLVWLARQRYGVASRLPLGLALFLLSPWFWSEVAFYGHFDVLVAAPCVFVVHGALGRRPVAAAAWLSLGIALKFLPAVLLPSVAFDAERRRFEVRPVVWVLLFCSVAFGIGYAIHGAALLEPFRFGGARASSGFSLFDYLRGPHSFLGWGGSAPNLDAWSHPVLGGALVATAGLVFVRRIDAATSALLLSLVLLALLRAGHSQFQMIPALLAAYWFVHHGAAHGRWLMASFVAYFAWLLLETIAWVAGPWPLLVSLDGLVHFAFTANLCAALVRGARRVG